MYTDIDNRHVYKSNLVEKYSTGFVAVLGWDFKGGYEPSAVEQ